MKKSLHLMLAGTAALFCACSDDSSSGSDNYTYEESGTFVADTQNKTITTTVQTKVDLCVNENNTYSWKEMNLGDEKAYMKYKFVGDSLVIFRECSSSFSYCSDRGLMFVGGKAGNLDGTWKSVTCEYDADDEKSRCYTLCSNVPGGRLTEEEAMEMYESGKIKSWDDIEENPTLAARLSCIDDEYMNDYTEMTIKISGSSFTTTTKYSASTEETFTDYTNSRFMTSLLEDLRRGRIDVPNISRLFREDSSDMEDLIEALKSYDIVLTSQTRNSLTFKYKDEMLSINIGNVSIEDESGSLSMTISSSKKTCSLEEESGVVTESTCKAEYGEFFSKEREEDALGNEFTYADYYEKSNEKDFEKCAEALLDSLFSKGKSTSNSGDCSELESEYTDCLYRGGTCTDIASEYSECLMNNSSYYDYDSGYNYEFFKKFGEKSNALEAKKAFVKNLRSFAREMNRAAK